MSDASTLVEGPVVATSPETPSARRKKKRGFSGARNLLSSLWLVALLLVAWEVVARIKKVRHFPPLSEIVRQFREDWLSSDVTSLFLTEHFWGNAGPSLQRFLIAWVLSIAIGVACGVALGRSRTLATMFNPVIRFSIATPKTILLPLAVTFFGVRDSMNIFLILIGTVWVVLINTMDAVAAIDRMWLRSAQSIGLTRGHLLVKVVIPAASPQILAGVRVSLGVGLILMVISELYATTSGIGYQITLAQRTFKYLPMWSAIMLVAMIGIALNVFYGLVEKRLLRWTRMAR